MPEQKAQNVTSSVEYHSYLLQRSRLGWLYRTTILYPRIARFLEGRVLDIGCGIGDMLRFRRGTVGTDINERNVAYCRSLGLEAHVMPVDALPFGDATFDSALLDNVIEHVAVPEPLLAEARRVLTPGGALVVGVPGIRGYAADDDHKRYYDEAGLVQLMTGCGFSRQTVIHTPLRSAYLDRKMRQYCVYGVFRRS